MRVLAGLLCFVTHVLTVKANVEKTIFIGPSAASLAHARPNLDDFDLHVLSHSNTILPTQLPVRFPSASVPRGLESWYLLQPLEAGRRYEVRICWPATQPTDFWLDTFTIDQVLDTPELHSSLATYSKHLQGSSNQSQRRKETSAPVEASLLFLRIQAAASFYTANRTLMESPEPVDVDIILDPFLLNILPRSLLPIGFYLIIVTIGAWYASEHIYRWLASIATEVPDKPHTD